MAVGGEYGGTTVGQTLIESWNGTSWSVLTSPNVGTSSNSLNGVSCLSARSCVAVGSYGDSGSPAQTLIESWNGSMWSVITSPNVGIYANYLDGVSCVSASSCVAVGGDNEGHGGRTLIESWNGSSWSVVTSPNNGTGANALQGVSCISAKSCMAVGTSHVGLLTLAEHWNGTTWSLVPSPNKGSYRDSLDGVSCVATTSCKAVGSYTSGTGGASTLIESWSGTKWSVITSPNVGTSGGSALNGISCVSASSCKAVGDDGFSQRTLVESWNGTAWSVSPSGNEGTNPSWLLGVSCVSANSCKAAGGYFKTNIDQTLVESYG